MVGIIAAIVLVIGFIGWKVFAGPSDATLNAEQTKARQAAKNKREGD
jgi:hypothetical protein